jgi:hypothetical protein
MPEIELAQLQQWQQQAQQIDLSSLAEYFQLEGAYYVHINGTSFRNNAFHKLFTESLPPLRNALTIPSLLTLITFLFFEINLTLPALLFESLVLSLNVSPTFITDGFFLNTIHLGAFLTVTLHTAVIPFSP